MPNYKYQRANKYQIRIINDQSVEMFFIQGYRQVLNLCHCDLFEICDLKLRRVTPSDDSVYVNL
jgi:hypothetical protein